MTVHHEYIGLRWYQVSPSTSVHRVKQLLYEETNLPVKEQRLSHNGRLVSLLFGPEPGGSSVPVGSCSVSALTCLQVFLPSCPPDALVAPELWFWVVASADTTGTDPLSWVAADGPHQVLCSTPITCAEISCCHTHRWCHMCAQGQVTFRDKPLGSIQKLHHFHSGGSFYCQKVPSSFASTWRRVLVALSVRSVLTCTDC